MSGERCELLVAADLGFDTNPTTTVRFTYGAPCSHPEIEPSTSPLPCVKRALAHVRAERPHHQRLNHERSRLGHLAVWSSVGCPAGLGLRLHADELEAEIEQPVEESVKL